MILTAHTPRIVQNPKYSPNKRKRAGEAKRIEALGALNDRHKAAAGARDRQALVEIAGEYALIGCVNMASQIAAEAEGL